MYGRCGSVTHARQIFELMGDSHIRDLFSWSAILHAYIRNGHLEEAKALFDSMDRWNVARQAIERYASLIRECSGEGTLAQGKCVHSQLVSDGWGHVTFLQNLLVEMYGRCGSLSEALSVFQGIEMPSIFSWTLVIAASSRNGDFGGALDLIRRMLLGGVKPDEAALVAVVNVAAGLEDISFSRQVHAWVVEARHGCELVVGNALISMHWKCRDSGWAERVFYGMQETDVISWTSMAAAYAQNGQHAETLQLFRKMDVEGVKRNFVTFVTLVEACTRFLDLENGRVTHSRIKSSGFCSVVIVSNSLIHMYTKCGDLASAIDVFRGMGDRNTISWTAMVAAYTQHGHCNEAIKHFQFMDLEGVKPDVVTLVAVVHACGGVMVLSKAREIHARVSDSGYFNSNVPLANAVISMYGRCGGLDDARDCFRRLRLKNTISWSSLIAIYAQDGQGEEAIRLFKLMVLDGVRPNSSSCASLLSAYSHEGDVHDCRECFAAIASDFGLEPTKDHFAGVVDLLARLGMLDRALELINTMPFVPDVAVFLALLSACCVHEDLELGSAAAEQASGLDPADESPYVLLSNVYAALGVWGEAL
ncbi:hypothetical protein SELMODRAFT_108854 [Selaginella moellendorffii]|uniref:Pentacotripeptide-repeat region of PRORP domain-containing protein n=1 Tax=Selaginella moellendorffii TaxID=88036 RepID=D8S4Z6_SELML|nr:hypothetical protein SELMODRAFT_108854 [Selaginella moellendorffii]